MLRKQKRKKKKKKQKKLNDKKTENERVKWRQNEEKVEKRSCNENREIIKESVKVSR